MRFIGGTLPRAAAWRKFLQMPGAWALQGFAMFTVLEKASGDWLGQLGPWQPEGWPGTEVGWAFKRAALGPGLRHRAGDRGDRLGLRPPGLERSDPFDRSRTTSRPRRWRTRLGASNRGPGKLPAPFENEPIDIWAPVARAVAARARPGHDAMDASPSTA